MDADRLFNLANTLNAEKYSLGYKYGSDILYYLHEANLYVMKAALEIQNSKRPPRRATKESREDEIFKKLLS